MVELVPQAAGRAVKNLLLAELRVLGQGRDHLAQVEQRLVDLDCLLQLLRVSELTRLHLHVRLPLAACKVHELQLRNDQVVGILEI